MKRPWTDTWDWPLVAIIVLFFALVVFMTADIWLPGPFPHR